MTKMKKKRSARWALCRSSHFVTAQFRNQRNWRKAKRSGRRWTRGRRRARFPFPHQFHLGGLLLLRHYLCYPVHHLWRRWWRWVSPCTTLSSPSTSSCGCLVSPMRWNAHHCHWLLERGRCSFSLCQSRSWQTRPQRHWQVSLLSQQLYRRNGRNWRKQWARRRRNPCPSVTAISSLFSCVSASPVVSLSPPLSCSLSERHAGC